MSWNREGPYFESCSCDVVCPSIEYEGKAAFSTSSFSWAA